MSSRVPDNVEFSGCISDQMMQRCTLYKEHLRSKIASIRDGQKLLQHPSVVFMVDQLSFRLSTLIEGTMSGEEKVISKSLAELLNLPFDFLTHVPHGQGIDKDSITSYSLNLPERS